MDFVDKSSVQGHMNLLGLAEELRAKVRALASVPRARAGRPPGRAPSPAPRPRPAAHGAEVVVIGTSTGGPPALQAIIPRLPAEPGRAPPGRAAHAGRLHALAGRAARPAQRAARARGARTASRSRRAGADRARRPAHEGAAARRAGRGVWLDDEPRTRAAPAVDRRAHGVGGRGLRAAACWASCSPAWARTASRACARSARRAAARWPRARRPA